MKWLAAILLIFVTSATFGNDWVYRDGYWWLNNQAYSVQKVRVYENGCWVYRWNYIPISTQNYALPSYKDAAWRDKLTEIVAAKERYQAAMNLSALEHAEWLEAVKAVGFNPNQTYGLRYATGNYGAAIYAQNGSSVYGTIETQNYYNPSNLDVQWNQADRHVDKAQNLAGEAMNGFREVLREASTQESSAKERVAAIYAKAALLKAADTPEITIRKQTFGQNIQGGIKPIEGGNDLIAVISGRCAGCHNAANPQGTIDMTKYLAFDEETKAKVRTAITNPNPEERMPKKKEGDKFVPDEPLSFDELMVFK